MTLEELKRHFGKWINLSKATNQHINNITRWRKQGYLPFKIQLLIQHRTNGLFIAREEDDKKGKS